MSAHESELEAVDKLGENELSKGLDEPRCGDFAAVPKQKITNASSTLGPGTVMAHDLRYRGISLYFYFHCKTCTCRSLGAILLHR